MVSVVRSGETVSFTMPWYITLALFIIAPIYGLYVRDAIWPKVADWWATRSRGKTEERIKKLENQLAAIQSLPLLSEFEDMVLLGLSGLVVLTTMMLPVLVALFYLVIFLPPDVLSWALDYREIMIALFLLLTNLIGYGVSQGLEKFRKERNLKHREAIQKDIDSLRARLAI